MIEKDYSLLRPFDLEAAKRGEALMRLGRGEWMDVTFVAEGGEDGNHAVRKPDGNLDWGRAGNLRIAPLAWVEGKPVYPGDGPLYYNSEAIHPGARFEPISRSQHDKRIYGKSTFLGGDVINGHELISKLTWQPPKVKRTVKMLGYRDDATGMLALLEEYPAPPLGLTRDEALDREIEVEQ